jgi:flagellar M-ring protein FliF
MLSQLQQQFLTFWNNQSSTQKLVFGVLVVAGCILVPLFIGWASTPSYEVAFSGLSEADAGQIVEKLTENGTTYKLQGSGTILVPTDQVYEVRLRMANESLPEGGTVGFELFNGNTLGMTEFSQKINYQRALEGELERTIASLTGVASVRVHIVTPEKSLLSSKQQPVTAAVTLKISPGAMIDHPQVRAITQLVASSVEGLQSENVAVVDVNGNLLAVGFEEGNSGMGAAVSDSRHLAEAAYAASVEQKVSTLLDSVLGPNRAVVKANVTLNWTEKEITRQFYDPETSAVLSSQVISEGYTNNGDSDLGGVPGADSNLPIGSDETVDENGNTYQRTEEVTNYELSQTQEYEVISPGEVETISISVLVDDLASVSDLQTLEEAVAAAAGIDTERGDILAVEALEFDHTYFETQDLELETAQKNNLYLTIGQGVGGVLIIGALLWYVQRLLSKLRVTTGEAWTPVMVPAGQMALGNSHAGPSLPLEEPSKQFTDLPIQAPVEEIQPEPVAPPPRRPELPPAPPEDEHLKSVISRLADENPATVADILHIWLSEDEARNG